MLIIDKIREKLEKNTFWGALPPVVTPWHLESYLEIQSCVSKQEFKVLRIINYNLHESFAFTFPVLIPKVKTKILKQVVAKILMGVASDSSQLDFSGWIKVSPGSSHTTICLEFSRVFANSKRTQLS